MDNLDKKIIDEIERAQAGVWIARINQMATEKFDGIKRPKVTISDLSNYDEPL